LALFGSGRGVFEAGVSGVFWNFSRVVDDCRVVAEQIVE